MGWYQDKAVSFMCKYTAYFLTRMAIPVLGALVPAAALVLSRTRAAKIDLPNPHDF